MAKPLLMFDPEDISAVATETAVNKFEFQQSAPQPKKSARWADAL